MNELLYITIAAQLIVLIVYAAIAKQNPAEMCDWFNRVCS